MMDSGVWLRGARTWVRIALSGVAVVLVPAQVGLAVADAPAPVVYPPAVAVGVVSRLNLVTLSTRSDMVSGGDVLVRLDVPPAIPRSLVTVLLNDSLNVADAFHAMGDTDSLVGYVTGLPLGKSTLTASVRKSSDSASLTLTNYPASGPIFSGPHETPFVCETERFTRGTLGPPLDADCSVYPRVEYRYKSVDGGAFKPLPANGALPADVAQTTTITGNTVPFTVRLETGTINRAIYEIAVLHDPNTERPHPWTVNPGWNKRLIYTHGGGCRSGWYDQGTATGGVLDDVMLGRGYAVVSSSLNVFGNNCNDLLASETHVMVKEHFIENYGVPRFTIAWGSSGGSYQSHQTADNYPGVFDGLIVAHSFPDVISATIFTLADSRLLYHYFNDTAKGMFTADQQRAVAGFGQAGEIANLSDNAKRIDPIAEFAPSIPKAIRYDPLTNRTGARGDVFDHTVNVFGRDPDSGFARRPLDNVGLQYGLAALNSGAVSTDQFLDLNERIGGLDRDAQPVPARIVADTAAARAAYETGRILNGGGGLASTPIIDQRDYLDDVPNGDIHLRIHGFSTRERLMRANGTADNQVMLVQPRGFILTTTNPVLRDAIDQMDRWLVAVGADTSNLARAQKVIRDKPADLVEACFAPSGEKIVEHMSVNAGRCQEMYPTNPGTRLAAGAPLTNDVVKCQLKPIDAADYKVSFTPDETARLGRIFPSGVCDWSLPGVEQVPLRGTWISLGS